MKNTFGNAISITLFGESHGDSIGAVVDGLAPGIKINHEYIKNCLNLRRPYGKISTSRKESDEYQIVSGEYCGYTTGTPLTLIIKNTAQKSSDYDALSDTPRPSHADYTAECKYHGFQDPRGGGHFSGRITAPLVAVGALIAAALMDKGIEIGTHIASLSGIADKPIEEKDIPMLRQKLFPVIDADREADMIKRIEAVALSGDSIGGVLETMILGIPAGVGEPFFDSVESIISHIVFSIPGVKGIEFGKGFGFADTLGSEANDSLAVSDGKTYTLTNNNGGINGGISNGMPITFRTAVKPTPSIFKEQKTISLSRCENTTLTISGRHDPAIIHRARAVVDAAAAIAIADLLTQRFGTDYLK